MKNMILRGEVMFHLSIQVDERDDAASNMITCHEFFINDDVSKVFPKKHKVKRTGVYKLIHIIIYPSVN